MPRLRFEKTGNAVWISHLDLMRLFQRAFKRAGLPLKHSQGFSPRPQVAIALPLSVGVESKCELLDFELEGDVIPNPEIKERLNRALVAGVKVRHVYDNAAKLKNLSYLSCMVTLEYDAGIPMGAQEAIQALFARESLTVTKKSKNGDTEQDIIPMIKKLEVLSADSNTLELHATVCCQNPSLNPMQLHNAIGHYLPEMTPDFSKCRRVEIYDTNMNLFR
jgi:radical SAM-linked protein